jgi:hypothetical protein
MIARNRFWRAGHLGIPIKLQEEKDHAVWRQRTVADS